MPANELDRPTIIQLGESRPGPCVSIFMPLRGIGTDVRADQTRLSQLGDRAVDLVCRLHIRNEDAKRLVEPHIAAAREEAGAWNRPGSGMALFFTPEETYSYSVPVELTEQVAVGPRFLTRPLAQLVELESPAYVLALGLNGTRLYRVKPEKLEAVSVKGMPESVEAVTQFEDTKNPERYLTTHSGGRVSHGQGGPGERSEAQVVTEFLRAVSASVRSKINTNHSVLALAGEKTVLDEFRKIANGMRLASSSIQGSARRVNGPELLPRAWDVLREETARRRTEFAKQIVESWSGPRVAVHVPEVLPMAIQGRVMDLFIANDAEQWGRVEDDGKVIEDRGHISLGSDDLLDLCSHHTLKNGGRLHAVNLAEMPGGPEAGAAVALLRT